MKQNLLSLMVRGLLVLSLNNCPHLYSQNTKSPSEPVKRNLPSLPISRISMENSPHNSPRPISPHLLRVKRQSESADFRSGPVNRKKSSSNLKISSGSPRKCESESESGSELGNLSEQIASLLISGKLKSSQSEPKSWDEEEGLIMTIRGRNIDYEMNEMGTFIKYEDDELEGKELLVGDNGFVQRGDSPLLENFIYNYVMHRNGKIYVEIPREGYLYHSSLAGKDDPIAAGEIRFKERKIFSMNEHSGHYSPKNRVQYVVQELKNRNALFYEDNFRPEVSTWDEVGREKRIQDTAKAQKALEKILQNKNQDI